jgi:site-specific recombinase XerD
MDGDLARVIHLPTPAVAPNPDAVFAELMAGWRRQQLSRNIQQGTIQKHAQDVFRFVDLSGHFPWEWTVGDVDEVFAHARSVQNLAQSTVRSYQTSVKLFCDFVADPAYDWNELCDRSFGSTVSQVVTEFNRARHVQRNEQQPEKRPFTRRELQDFFDLADLEVERVLNSRRKGAVTAYRDSVAFKTAYAWGLRANETTHLQIVDFSRNPHAPQFGDFGVLQVRYGKSQKGSPPKRRSVLTVFDWSAQTIHEWMRGGLPRLNPKPSDLFPTGTGLVVPKSNLRRRFAALIQELGFPAGLDLHSFRRSYATHLAEFYGFQQTFIQRQLGHEHASTTSIYTLVSDDYQVRELNRVLEQTLIDATRPLNPWEKPA